MGKPATTVGFITQSLKPHGCLQALKEAKVRHGCHNYKAVSESVQADSKQREKAGWWRCHGLGSLPQTNEGNLSQAGLPGNPEFQVANPHEVKAWEDLSMTTVVRCFLEMHELCTRCHLIPHILEVRGDTQPTDFSLMLWKYIRFLCV